MPFAKGMQMDFDLKEGDILRVTPLDTTRIVNGPSISRNMAAYFIEYGEWHQTIKVKTTSGHKFEIDPDDYQIELV